MVQASERIPSVPVPHEGLGGSCKRAHVALSARFPFPMRG